MAEVLDLPAKARVATLRNCVYRLNDPALQLYKSAGFAVVENWEDKAWLAGIESGALGPPQKLLMAMRL
eukprot:scaffold62227_cov37-Prasinocladus_malaysianus.AAC.1